MSTGKADLSPVLSLNGIKIAFIESNDGGGNTYTAFHVLTWKASEGIALGSPAVPGNCAPGNSCMTMLVLSNTRSDSRSEPFIDYALDVAYVGDDGGLLHKITPVFNGTPAEVIGGGWPVILRGGGQVQSPVYDSVSGNVFVTSNAGGTLFVVNSSSGATSTVSTNALFPSEPIVDPPARPFSCSPSPPASACRYSSSIPLEPCSAR